MIAQGRSDIHIRYVQKYKRKAAQQLCGLYLTDDAHSLKHHQLNY